MSRFKNQWAGGAQGSFFRQGLRSEFPWSSTFRSLLYATVGIAIINQMCRGNIWGEVAEGGEVVIPLPLIRKKDRNLSSSGFVGGSDQE
ncbi:Hypothetical protein, putative [Bodo saltans]|uniref:Uncharacterized protein n=1 Tax=Bodo saltans TaxID=75058 RepID=A0A0S4IRX3_BODSA|nr:Hypothetical protein, putative [Bodo saltans]|eukprot:CUF14454.1 Hypothetical protein, putative [Bodo saltans]